jgi:hypothetical protein
VKILWDLLNKEDLHPVNGHPKHLHWALHFLKNHQLQAPGCAAISLSDGAIDPNTHQKWVWAYIKAISMLVDEVVSLFCCYFFIVSN